jgi:hypothetical protein
MAQHLVAYEQYTAPTSGVRQATRPSTTCKKPMTIIKAMIVSPIN